MSIENPGRVPDRYTQGGDPSGMDMDGQMKMADANDDGQEDDFNEPAPDMGLPGTMNRLKQLIDSDNIALLLSDEELDEIGKQVVDDYELDKDSCATWYDKNQKALELAKQQGVSKSFPWEGAANIVVPLITSAAISFNARVYPELITDGGVAKTRILGKSTPDKEQRAERVQNHLNYQLLFQMDEWEQDTDKMLMILAVSGVAYRKVYFDPIKGRNCSTILTADQVVVNNGITSLQTARRISHILEMFGNDIESKKRAGLYREIDLHVDAGSEQADQKQPDDDPMYRLIEQHRWLDLDDDGLEEPYIVTVDKDSNKVLRIVARYDERDVKHKPDGTIVSVSARSHFIDYHFCPSFDGSYMSYGFGILLGNLNKAANSLINALLNAGLLSNTQGGFLAKGFRMQGGNKPLSAGEWRKTDVAAEILQQSLLPIPAKEPSAVLYTLFQTLTEMAQGIISVQSIGLDQLPGNAPAASVLSVIEQGSKTFNATFKRVYRSLTAELRLLGDLNQRYLPDEEYFRLNDSEGNVARDDYATTDFDIIPVADPSVTTQAQRMAIANTTFEVAKQVPGSNIVEAGRNVLKAIGNPDVDQIIAPSGDQTLPPEIQQQMQALQQQAAQAHQLLQQAGQEMAMLNVLLANKSKENAIRAFEALTKADIGASTIQKNLADAVAKADAVKIAAYEAHLSAVDKASKTLGEIINATATDTGNGEGMAGAPGNGGAPAEIAISPQ